LTFISKLDEIPPEAHCLYFPMLLPIFLEGFFGLLDIRAGTVPVLQFHQIEKEFFVLVPVVGADALHLIQENSLVELNNSLFQLFPNGFRRPTPVRDIPLVRVAIFVHVI
jgi:hypothetical protein